MSVNEEKISAIEDILKRAGEAHHAYEKEMLGGVYDKEWAAWYAHWANEHGFAVAAGARVDNSRLAVFLADLTEQQKREGSQLPWGRYCAEKLAGLLG